MLKKNQVEGLSLPDIKIHYKTIIRPCAIAIKRDKYLNQWNREHRYKYIYIETWFVAELMLEMSGERMSNEIGGSGITGF